MLVLSLEDLPNLLHNLLIMYATKTVENPVQ